MQVTPLNPKVTNKSLLLTVDECGLREVDQHFYVDVPYSGKFLHGAKFRVFHGWSYNSENKNRECLNGRDNDIKSRRARCDCAHIILYAFYGCGFPTELCTKIKTTEIFWNVWWHFCESLHP